MSAIASIHSEKRYVTAFAKQPSAGRKLADDISAYVNDGFFGPNQGTNYVFTVMEPATLTLMGLGLAGIGFSRRKAA